MVTSSILPKWFRFRCLADSVLDTSDGGLRADSVADGAGDMRPELLP
jgi:hypothetical protein